MRRLAVVGARDRGSRGGAALLTRMLLMLCLCAAALAAGQSAAAQTDTGAAGATIEVAGTIVARELADGRIEVGFRPTGGERILPSSRILPGAELDRQLRASSDVLQEDETLGRVVARRAESGRIEFGFSVEGGETVWPERRFLPAGSDGRWLRSSEIRFTVARNLIPSFGGQSVPDHELYLGAASAVPTFPQAEGGDGELSYSLTPAVAGLTFDPQLRRLSGTPTRTGSYSMVYRVRDADGDEDELRFTIEVNDAAALGIDDGDAMMGDGGAMMDGDASMMGGDDSMDAGDAMMGGGGGGGGGLFRTGGGAPVSAPQPPSPPRDTTFVDNPRSGFVEASEDAVSTFSLDVDRTSYFLALNWANAGYPIDPASVRAEEWVNAFDFGYDAPSEDDRFAITTALMEHPTVEGLQLARIGFRAPEAVDDRPLNVTLVLDASGSMAEGNRVEIARAAAESIRGGLRSGDRIAVVQFSTDVLDEYTVRPTRPGDARVAQSLANLRPNYATNVQAGLDLGLQLAAGVRSERPDAINYVILMSDGVANVNATDPFAILDESGDRDPANPLRLITVGVGIANYNDYLLEQLAQHGNGWYRYLSTPAEAQAVFSRENWLALSRPFADQTRAQVRWDSGVVKRWRLVGYENRVTSDESFTEDRNEFAEIPAGLSVTAFYELELTEAARAGGGVIDLGEVELRWLTPARDEARSQLQGVLVEDGRGWSDEQLALLDLGALVALSSDRYSRLSELVGSDAALVRRELERLDGVLDGLGDELGSLEAYRDLRFLLAHLIDGLPADTESGYSR